MYNKSGPGGTMVATIKLQTYYGPVAWICDAVFPHSFTLFTANENKSENVHISYNQMRMFSRIFWTSLDFVHDSKFHVWFFRYNLSLVLVDNSSLCQKDAVVFFAHSL